MYQGMENKKMQVESQKYLGGTQNFGKIMQKLLRENAKPLRSSV